MTEKQAIHKIKELIINIEKNDSILKRSIELIKSKGIKLSDFEDNYAAPKIILYVALLHEASQWEPMLKENRKVANKLKLY